MPVVSTESENDREWQNHETSQSPQKLYIVGRERVNLPEYLRFMRIHNDSSMIHIASHRFRMLD